MNSNMAVPHSRMEEKVMLEQAIAASLGEPIDEQALLVARRQQARTVHRHPVQTTSSSATSAHWPRPQPMAMKRPKGVFC